MAEQTTDQQPLNPLHMRALVQGIATREDGFHAFVTFLQPFLVRGETLPAETALALSNALHDVEYLADKRDAINRMIDGEKAPALVVDEAGRILSSNQAMREHHCVGHGETLLQFGVLDNEFQAFKERLSAPQSSTLLNITILDNKASLRPLLMVGQYDAERRVYVLTALQQHWPASIERAVMDLFGLSPRETEILAGLATGLSLDEIAQRHARKVSTIRQQTKSLLKKMGAATQTQAATLAAAASNAVNWAVETDTSTVLHSQREPWVMGDLLRAGRRIGWRCFGDPNGIPVLLVHGPSFAAGEFEQDRYWAKQHGLNIYAVERPGYGRTDRPARQEDPLQCQVDDIQAVLDTLQVTPRRIVAHEVGLITALAWLQQQPHTIERVVGVSCAPPFRELEQLTDMPAQQGIFILAARHAPWMAKLLIRLLVIRLRRLGSERWYEAVFSDVPTDLAVTQQPEFQQGVVAAYAFYTQQAGAGFEVDLQVMIRNWEHLITSCTVPVTLLHGQQNPTTLLADLLLFKHLNAQISVEQFPECGLTLALSEAETIYARLAQ